MCLITFSYKQHPKYKLILAANRDEFYKRPTSPAQWNGNVLSGIDKQAGGTWMGISRHGRVAALTNFRNPADMKPSAKSRGAIVSDYLHEGIIPDSFEGYNGFNLIFGDIDNLSYLSNRIEGTLKLNPGIYGLSNHLLDTPWVKVERIKEMLTETIQEDFSYEELFKMLKDDFRPADNKLPDTGISIELERLLSSICIKSEDYGTVSSTVLTIDNDNNVTFIERTHATGGEAAYRFKI